MKSLTTTFALLALLALIPCMQCMAQTPSAAAPVSVAQFLDTLSSGQSVAPVTGDQTPSPTPMATSCSSSADCPRGQLCCYPCGIDGCTPTCMKPLNGSCPRFP